MSLRLHKTSPFPARLHSTLPANTRPIIRYREESFGFLAAFPDGRLGLYRREIEPELRAGTSYDDCESHLLESIPVAKGFHFRAPLLGWLEITRACNLRCAHCFVEGGPVRGGELATEEILALLDTWADMGVLCVVITGGEPTIHPDFVDIVGHAHDLGFAVSIATHGKVIARDVILDLPRTDVIISVSLDGEHNPRGLEAEFPRVTERLLALQSEGFHTSIMTTTTRANVGQLRGIIEWAIDHNVSLRSVPFVPMGRGLHHRELGNNLADVELASRFWIEEEKWERKHDRTLGLCTGKVYNFLLAMAFATRRCMSGRGLCYVDSAGDVYPCTTCSGGKTLPGGNVHTQGFRDIWADENWDIRKITWSDYTKVCEGCPIDHPDYFCTGRCPGSSNTLHGHLFGCGMSDFQRASTLRREELFREQISTEPRVTIAHSKAAEPQPSPSAPGQRPCRQSSGEPVQEGS